MLNLSRKATAWFAGLCWTHFTINTSEKGLALFLLFQGTYVIVGGYIGLEPAWGALLFIHCRIEFSVITSSLSSHFYVVCYLQNFQEIPHMLCLHHISFPLTDIFCMLYT